MSLWPGVWVAVVSLAAWLLPVAPAAADQAAPLRRFAFVAGSNDGGERLEKLRYAETDARSFAAVLQDLGGVKPNDLVLVTSPSLQRFKDGLQRVRQMVGAPREMEERRELIFYYSGHSDDGGLILGRDQVRWEDLRGELAGIPADVKVAIVDSCSSGSLTRAKGGQARPAFLWDASSDMSGHAYLTSASAEEAAQESDRIGSSFFTHYLISGLRGAADTAGDGLVTLNEAYTYAFQETLASTERTEYGPQHPAYDISLSGSGDLVLTDLRTSGGLLRVGDEITGRLYIRDSQGALAVELNKSGGQVVELGLEPGVYHVVLDTRSSRLEGSVRVSGRQPALLTMASLRPVTADRATARGPDPEGGRRAPSSAADPANSSNPAAAIGAAVGAVVGSAIGQAMDAAVSAAIGAAGGASARRAPSQDGSAAEASRDAPPPEGDGSEAARDSFGSRPAPEMLTFSLVPDFSQGWFASRTDHLIGLNLLVGSSGSLYGFELGGLANLESGDVVGFQWAGLANASLGSLTGFQAAGLVNVTRDASVGGQVAGLVNYSGGPVRGAQVAGIANWAPDGISGAQVAGVANRALEVRGPQISVVNVAGSVTGTQVGVINIADHVSGVQLGVLNISRQIDGVPIGVVSIEGRGRHALDLWMDTDGVPYAAFSLGTRWLYTVFSAGWSPGSSSERWSLGLGLGTRAQLRRLFIDFDLSMVSQLSASYGWDSPPAGRLYPRARAVVGVPLTDWFALEAGLSFRVLVPGLSDSIPGASPTDTIYQTAFLVGVHLG